MKRLSLIQGSDKWKATREDYRVASDASVMMAAHYSTTRDELLRLKHSGTKKEFSDYVQKYVLDKGHEIEAKARPLAEQIVGDELFPVTGISDDGLMLASFDGLTDCGSIIWECKQWNESKAQIVDMGEVPECDKWQVVHQLVVSRAEKCLYMVTDGTPEKCVYVWYSLQDGDEETLLDGWAQFAQDLANYQPPEAKPVVVANPVDSLPVPVIELAGQVTTNTLPSFKEHVQRMLEAIPSSLETDQQFADAKLAVKALEEGEKKLKAAKEAALSRTADIEEVFRTLGDVSEMMRQKRLALKSQIQANEDEAKRRMACDAACKFASYTASLNQEIGYDLPHLAADFAKPMKNKKTMASRQSAINDELAKFKIEADKWARIMRANLEQFKAVASGHQTLFPDLNELLWKPAADFEMAVQFRISQHQEEQRKREEQAEAARKAAESSASVREEFAGQAHSQEAPKGSIEDVATPSPAISSAPSRTLEDALNHFCTVKGLGKEDAQELIDIVASFNAELNRAA